MKFRKNSDICWCSKLLKSWAFICSNFVLIWNTDNIELLGAFIKKRGHALYWKIECDERIPKNAQFAAQTEGEVLWFAPGKIWKDVFFAAPKKRYFPRDSLPVCLLIRLFISLFVSLCLYLSVSLSVSLCDVLLKCRHSEFISLGPNTIHVILCN